MPSYKLPAVRKEEIIRAAVVVAERQGFMNMRREDVALEAECSCGSVNRYFGNMNQLRIAVMRRAVIEEVLPIVATGLAMSHTQALKASPELQRKAVKSLMPIEA